MKAQKHQAEQFVAPEIDPPIRLALTLTLEGDTARLWRQHAAFYQGLAPSNAQLVVALMKRGLLDWESSKGAKKGS